MTWPGCGSAAKLPQLTSAYTATHASYAIISINGHFTHASAIPAIPTSAEFSAERILTPTVEHDDDTQAFFKLNGGAPALLYSVGCHSGLSVAASDFFSPTLRADFPEAIVKQGGNWIGNTGYGYGDTDMVGYSERLSLLFTSTIGRNVTSGHTYVGETIGRALARAKRQYPTTSGADTFSVFDEKVITEWTLYGLPFTTCQGAQSACPTTHPRHRSPAILSTLVQTGGVFTRVITMTNTYEPLGANSLLKVYSAVQDSFAGTTHLTSTQQTALERPVLPLLTFDIALQSNPIARSGRTLIPRGVRLRSATMLPDLAGFDPHITTLVTDTISGQVAESIPSFSRTWLPALPYTATHRLYVGHSGDRYR